MLADLLIHNTSAVFTCAGPAPRRGPAQAAAGMLARGVVASHVAATLNAAYSLDLDSHVGSLEPGKQTDAVIVDRPAVELIRIGAPTIRLVIKRGRIIECASALC